MPPLPRDRMREAAVFEVVGIDFAEPLYLRGGVKTWICLFTCAVYRVVHLDVVVHVSLYPGVASFLGQDVGARKQYTVTMGQTLSGLKMLSRT